MTTEERYKDALERIATCKAITVPHSIAGQLRDIANNALNPTPQYEEVEVVRWGVYWKNSKTLEGTYETEEEAKKEAGDLAAYIVKLTGTYRREVKPKVKRREEIEPGHDWLWENPDMLSKRPENSKCYFEWYEEAP